MNSLVNKILRLRPVLRYSHQYPALKKCHNDFACGSVRALRDVPVYNIQRRFCRHENRGTKIDDFRKSQEKLEAEYEKNVTTMQSVSTANVAGDSAAEPKLDERVIQVRTDILNSAMQHVEAMGWTKETIAKGAESIGYPGVVHGMFPRGAIELIEHFYSDCNRRLVDMLEQEYSTRDQSKPLKIDEYLTRAVRMRLEMLQPHLKHWPQATAIMSLPQNAVRSLANLLTLVDDICYYSGDRSVDFAWYARRVGLAGMLKVTELYMLQDKSVDYRDTWTFLDRRMEEAMLVNMYLDQAEVSQNMQKAVDTVFTTARNILGMNFHRR